MGLKIHQGLQTYIPNLTATELLRLNFECDKSLLQPLMWTMTESLKSLWKTRIERTKTTLEEVRASVEASWKIMKETRFTNATTLTLI